MTQPETTDHPSHHVLLDASTLACPLPLLKAKQALNRMNSGEVLKVIATDAGSVKDFAVFARQSGNTLLLSQDLGDHYQYWIQKK
jgi:tRNA 2-thiouridine synthesizing protein A